MLCTEMSELLTRTDPQVRFLMCGSLSAGPQLQFIQGGVGEGTTCGSSVVPQVWFHPPKNNT